MFAAVFCLIQELLTQVVSYKNAMTSKSTSTVSTTVVVSTVASGRANDQLQTAGNPGLEAVYTPGGTGDRRQQYASYPAASRHLHRSAHGSYGENRPVIAGFDQRSNPLNHQQRKHPSHIRWDNIAACFHYPIYDINY